VIVERRFLPFAATLFLLGAGTFFFWPILVEGRVPVFRDILDTTVPLGHYIGARLREGKLPQWFPYDGLGLPFIGQLNESAFHPASWLYAVLPLAAALRCQLLLGYLAAAFGQLLFARKLGMSWTASALAAAAFTFSGYLISLSNLVPYLWGIASLPWLGLFALEVYTRERPWPWVAALAMCWATIVVAGDSHSALFGGVVALFTGAQTGRMRRLPLCVLAALLAVGLAGSELLPALDLVREGPRAAWSTAENMRINSSIWAFHPYRWFELVFPNWMPLGTAVTLANTVHGDGGVWAISVYAGAPVVALALAGLLSGTRTGILSASLAVLGLWLATGIHGGLEPLLRHLPILSTLRFPEKHLGLFALALPLAAAAGLDSLRDEPRRAVPIALAAVAGACALGALLLPREAAIRIWPWMNDIPEHVARLHQAWRGSLFTAALSLLGASLLLAAAWKRPAFLALMPLLVFLDLHDATGTVIGVADPRFLTETPRFCAAARMAGAGPDGLRAVNVSQRKRQLQEMDDPIVWAANTMNLFLPAAGSLCGIGTIGPDAILSNEPSWVRWAIGRKHLEKSAALPLYGFGIVVRASPYDPPLKDEAPIDSLDVYPGEGLRLVKRPAAPRAYAAVPRWVPDGNTALREVEERGLGLVESPVLAGSGPPFTGTGSAGTVRITTYEPEHVVLAAEMTKSGAVILNDLAFRGWTATVDGVPARIYRANALARGVLVSEGSHRIEMNYELPRLRAGLATSGASLLLCFALMLVGLLRRGSSSSDASARETA
jgi:hypothetical protein